MRKRVINSTVVAVAVSPSEWLPSILIWPPRTCARSLEARVTNFARSVFLVRANLVFVGIRYKHFGVQGKQNEFLLCNCADSLRAVRSAARLSARPDSEPLWEI